MVRLAGGVGVVRPERPEDYPAVLLALLSLGPTHGHGLVQRLKARAGGELPMPAGLVYPWLHGLERDGLVSAHWAPGESGRRRRVYTLTASGRRTLGERTRSANPRGVVERSAWWRGGLKGVMGHI